MSHPIDAVAGAPATTWKPSIEDRLKVNNFDGLRLIFASMVVVFHIGLLSQQPELAPLHWWVSSTFAVQAFFFVSGFLVVMSFDRGKSLRSYFKKRTLRIAPAYIAVILAAAFLLAPLSTLPASEFFSSAEWRSYVVSNLMLSNFNQPDLPGVFQQNYEVAVNGSLWTIKIEVMFYCSVPFIVWAIRKLDYKIVLATIFVGSLIWQCGFVYLGEATGNDLYARLAKQLPGQLSFFAAGAFAYYRTAGGLPPPPAWAAVGGIILYAVTDRLLHHVVAPFSVALFTYWASIGLQQLWSSHKWGDFSYGVYLYHFPIAQTMISLGVFAAAPYLGLVAVCAATLLVSVASWHLIEKKALRFAHR